MTESIGAVDVIEADNGLIIQSREALSDSAKEQIRRYLAGRDRSLPLVLDYPLYVVDPNLATTLARIEAKLDALTDWSAWQDSNGRLIPKVASA